MEGGRLLHAAGARWELKKKKNEEEEEEEGRDISRSAQRCVPGEGI